jgi:inner membrane protein
MQSTPNSPLPPLPPLLPATPPAAPRAASSGRLAFGAKLACIGGLALLLLLPLDMIGTRLRERLNRRNEAIQNISSTWGSGQTLVGPILVVPYRRTVKVSRERIVDGRRMSVDENEFVTARAYFLPSELSIQGTLAPSQLHRGIYTATVYRGDLALSGTFAPPDFKLLKIDPAQVQWEDAVIALAITDLRGVRDALTLKLGATPLALLPGARLLGFASTVQARLQGEPFAAAAPVPFSLALALNGSENILFAPLGANTRMTLASTWPDPSFQGAFLPATRSVDPTGFTAEWQVSYYGRAYPQSWTDADTATSVDFDALAASTCGVSLVTPVDSYRLVERSIKYGVLFVALLFTGFFLFETLAGLRIHPLQYLLVGAALCLFYLALLSLSELMAFGRAYLAGAAASGLLTVCYSLAVLGKWRRAAAIAAELAAIYTFLYITLQLQDYALVFGTAGLFVTLAIVMYATRKVNWYEQGGSIHVR